MEATQYYGADFTQPMYAPAGVTTDNIGSSVGATIHADNTGSGSNWHINCDSMIYLNSGCAVQISNDLFVNGTFSVNQLDATQVFFTGGAGSGMFWYGGSTFNENGSGTMQWGDSSGVYATINRAYIQSNGAQTASIDWTSTEQAMLQACYNVFTAMGLIV